VASTETARRNHDELFPDRASTLAQTDPELIERFDNFAFDEVLADSDLDIRTRLMVQLASLIACQAVSEFRVMAGAGLTAGLTPVELKEIVYQAVPARRQRHAHRTRGAAPAARPVDNHPGHPARARAGRAEADRGR
jgi:alkylhydroperoxidase/carboxymuconolactone decarboxylase family protein YurZ